MDEENPERHKQLSGWRLEMHKVIFGYDTLAGKLFDILLVAAIILGFVSRASSDLSILTSLSPFSASLNICAPPAPQHSPLLRFLFISTRFASSDSNTFLGASYMPFPLPR